ncbi:MAG: AraC family transcriptional regulator [Kiritimatiellae bacterium]|nr:AraC family transcriptional regulator [Kiritimatiellia bacterium]
MTISAQMAKLIEDTLDCRFRSDFEMNVGQSHFTGWSSFPTPVVSLMLRGEMETTLRGPPRQTVRWGPGEAICLLPEMSRLNNIVSGGTVRYLGVFVAFEMLSGVDPLSFFNIPVLYRQDAAEPIALALRKIMAARALSDPFQKAAARQASCMELLHVLLASATMRADAPQRLSGLGRLAESVAHLRENYARALDVDRLARLAHLSPSRFYPVFKTIVGCSPGEFIHRLRLDAAVAMLAKDDLTIAEIGQQVGWNDPFHFSRTFKRFMGMSPKAYRDGLQGPFAGHVD